MRKLLFIIAVLFSLGIKAQTFTPIHNYQAPDGLDVAKFFGIPYGSTPTLNGVNRPNAHPLYYKTTDSSLYLYSGNQWIRVGGGNGNKDTVLLDEGLGVRFDSLGYQHIFAIHPDGYEGGIVTYSGTGFDFNVSPITLYLRNEVFLFPETTLTLSAPNSQPRYDIFGVDSLGAFVKSGDTSDLPLEPQVGIDSFALTKAFLISPGDTVPSGIDDISVYDETGTSPEFIASTSGTITTDLVNPDNPYHLSKAIYVSKYSNNSRFNFLSASQITIDDGQIITGYIYINSAISALNFRLYNSGTAVSNNIKITNGYGLNTVLLNQYQKFSIPLSAFTMSGTAFNTIRITNSGNDNSGAGGYYLDYLQFQTGINNVPQATDYSNKQDSNLVRNDSLFWVAKGIEHFVGKIGGGSTDTSHLSDRIDLKLNISDTASMLSPYIRTVDADAAYYPLTTNPSNYLQNVSGLIIEGDNVTITGDGTTDNPFVINSRGGDSTIIKVQQPIYYDASDSTLKFKNDSLPLMAYRPGIDTADISTDENNIPNLKWLLPRLGSGGISQDQLDDSTAAIRADFPSGGISSITAYDSTITATSSQTDFTFSTFPDSATYISVFRNGCAIDDSYYTYDAATQTLTFTTGRVDGDKIRLHIIE